MQPCSKSKAAYIQEEHSQAENKIYDYFLFDVDKREDSCFYKPEYFLKTFFPTLCEGEFLKHLNLFLIEYSFFFLT